MTTSTSRISRVIALCGILAVASACGDSDGVAPTTTTGASTSLPFPEGESLQSLDVDGTARNFLVYVPSGVVEPQAAVLVLHGGGGEGIDVAEVGASPLSVFRTVADREGFVVIYPEGLPSKDRLANRGWVDCRADNTVASGADDVGFLASLVATIGDAYSLTPGHIFMAGSSNGAQMTYAFVFHHPDHVGAVAVSAGNLAASPTPGPCTNGPGRPVPILMSHGTEDNQMPYDGGCVVDLGGACNRGRVVSAEETRDRWLAFNGLDGAAAVETVIDHDGRDAGAAHRFVYDGPAPVEWWRLDGAGHAAPSRTVFVATNRLTGAQNRDIEFAEVAWTFFERQQLGD